MRISCFKYTDDPSWYPNHFKNTVEVSLLTPLSNGQHRVLVSGNDDFAMEFDFEPEREMDAKNMYYTICLMEFVNQKALKELGFTIA